MKVNVTELTVATAIATGELDIVEVARLLYQIELRGKDLAHRNRATSQIVDSSVVSTIEGLTDARETLESIADRITARIQRQPVSAA